VVHNFGGGVRDDDAWTKTKAGINKKPRMASPRSHSQLWQICRWALVTMRTVTGSSMVGWDLG
jgi:hypothetical protein